MILPVWILVGFAAWTVLLLLATVGVYRWSRILTGRVAIREFRADQIEGADWYKRAMRAHANCVENLPVLAQSFSGCTLAMWAASGECAGSRGSGSPHHAIAGACMLRPDQHGDSRALRVLFRADRQFSLVNWNPAD
jgi:hypothetical protein